MVLALGSFAVFGTSLLAKGLSQTETVLQSAGGEFMLREAKGMFVALHFLPRQPDTQIANYVMTYQRQTSALPGVRHVFVAQSSDDATALTALLAEPGGREPTIYYDEGQHLRASFGEEGAFDEPLVVLLGSDGNVLFSRAGQSPADLISFSEFTRQVERTTVNPELSEYNLEKGKPAIGGFDPVAYFQHGKASKGREDIRAQYRGVTYQFESVQSRDLFARSPERYLPEYGGWCATAMAEGDKVEIDPENFKVTNGRLFLFYKGWLGNAIKDWYADEVNLMRRADAAWQRIAPRDRLPE